MPAGALMLLVTAGGLVAAPVVAQSRLDGSGQAVRAQNILSTPITKGRAWRVDIGVASLADNNFQRQPQGREIGALRITPVIDGGVGLLFGRQQLFLGGQVGRDFFINKAQFNRSLWALGGGVAWQVGSRCTGVVGAETRSQLLVQVNDQIRFTPNVQKTKSAAASATCQTAGGLGFGGTVRHDDVSNDTIERAAFDFRSTAYAPNITYGNSRLGQVSIGARIADVVYPRRPVATPAGIVGDGLATLNGRLGYSRTLGTRVQVTAGVSYLRSRPKPNLVLAIDQTGQIVAIPREPFTGTGYDFSVGYQPSSRLTVTVAGDRNFTTNQNVGALFTVAQTLSADIRYKIGPSLTFGIGGNRGTNDYKGSFVSPAEQQLRISDRFEGAYASLDYSPRKLYSVGFEIMHQRRKSNPATLDFKSTSAALRLRVRLGRG